MEETMLKRSASGYREFRISSVELNQHILWLTGEITVENAISFIRKLSMISMDIKKDPIKIFLSTNGGSIDAGFAIYDAMKLCPLPIYIYVVDHAYSIGAAILLAGEKRFAFPHSKVMIHRAWMKESPSGNADDFVEISKKLHQFESQYIQVISENTTHSIEEVKKDIHYDHYFTATEAMDYGFIHNIISESPFIVKVGDSYETI